MTISLHQTDARVEQKAIYGREAQKSDLSPGNEPICSGVECWKKRK